MSLQTKVIGRQPTDHGPYDPNLAYGKKFQCTLFGCAWESLHDNNNTAPALWDGGDTITPNLVDWKKVSGSYEAWLMNHDKPAASEQYPFNGMGRVRLQKNIVNGVNTLTQAMLTQQNTIYVIQYDFTLTGDVTIPANCVLEFDGGSISGAYTLTGNNTFISSDSICIKRDVVITGTWKNEIIYTRWLDLVSADDGSTDNLVVFRQLRDIINGTNGCKVEFEPGYYQYGCDIEPDAMVGNIPKYLTNVYSKPKLFAISVVGIPYVDINLNGSTIKALTTNAPMFMCIGFVNVDNAYIHDGSITGFANTFSYPVYINYADEQVRSYEWSYGIMQIGGYLTIKNINVSNFHGDGIVVGSGDWWLNDSAVSYIAKGYLIENCEVSYCARNGITLHSSLEGRLVNNHIHNIGSDAGNGEIGTDGIMGTAPREGIDVEFEDGQGLKPIMSWDNLYIHNCAAGTFGFATPTQSRTNNNTITVEI